jgi:hypothetical protein
MKGLFSRRSSFAETYETCLFSKQVVVLRCQKVAIAQGFKPTLAERLQGLMSSMAKPTFANKAPINTSILCHGAGDMLAKMLVKRWPPRH